MSILNIIELQVLVLVIAISIDAFVASIAYGTNKIKIPILSILIITTVCSLVLGVSAYFGNSIRYHIDVELANILSFAILFSLGTVKLFDSYIKSLIKKYKDLAKELKFSLFNFMFILNIYADPKEADVDSSRTISPSESFALALALSLDGLAIGFGAAIGNMRVAELFIYSLIAGALAIISGCFLGNKISQKINLNLSYLSGFLLILLAFIRL